MPIQSKSIWQQISNPRETYTDGYGATREVYEPGYITAGRKIYNGIDKFLNGPETVTIDGIEMPIMTGAGALELMNVPVGLVGKLDDVPALSKNLQKITDKWDKLARYKLRRKINKQPEARKRIFRNADKYFPNKNDFYDIESNINYIENRIDGDGTQYMDMLWRRGDLDGLIHPKVKYKYEELPF